DYLARPEVGLGVFGHGAQMLIDVVEQGSDKLRGGHRLLRTQPGFTLLASVEEVPDQCKGTIYILVCQRLTPSVNRAWPPTLAQLYLHDSQRCRRPVLHAGFDQSRADGVGGI